MQKLNILLSEPDLGSEEIEAVTKVIQSKWLTMGPVTAEFEKAFAEKMHVKHAVAVNNCTAALHLANVVLGIGPGDEVICPALTFVASANATRYTGAHVRFAGVISPDDLTVSPDSIERLITPATKAVTVVHYAGFPCAMDEILAIAERHGLAVIEDCAHAPFAQYRSTKTGRVFTGAIGQIGCFSFFSNKNMTTGEGGMLTTESDELARRLRLLRSHGMTSVTYDRHRTHASGYDVVDLGFNYRIDEIHSAIGLCQLKKIDTLHERRRQVFRWYQESLSRYRHIRLPFAHRDLEDASVHILPVVLDQPSAPVRKHLSDMGIQTSRHYEPIPHFSSYKTTNFSEVGAYTTAGTADDLHVTPSWFDNLMTLPLSPQMTREQVEQVTAALHMACESSRLIPEPAMTA